MLIILQPIPVNVLANCKVIGRIIMDKSKFIRLDKNFDQSKRFIELANGSHSNDIVLDRGVTVI